MGKGEVSPDEAQVRAVDESASGAKPIWRDAAWWPLPVLSGAIVVLWIWNPRTSYESPELLIGLNLVFSTIVSLFIAYLCARSFLARLDPEPLLLGCGMLVWGVASGVASTALARGGNFTITIHNLGVWVSALCYLAAGLLAKRMRPWVRFPALWLGVSYMGSLALVAFVADATLAGWVPTFFVQGEGGTPVRQFVLATATAALAFAAALLWRSSVRAPSGPAHWYSLGLGLLAIGLAGVMMQSVHGSLLSWLGRGTQYLGGVYMLVAAIEAGATSGGWDVSLADVSENGGGPRSLETRWGRRVLGAVLRYVGAVAAVLVAFGLRVELEETVGGTLPLYITFYPAVMLVALLLGFGPGLVATGLVTLVVVDWILPPEGLGVAARADRLSLVLFIAMGFLMAGVAELYRRARRRVASYAQERRLRESQEELRRITERERFLADVVDHAAQAFAVAFPDGRLGLFNRAFEELTGYTGEELRGMRWDETLTPPEWRELERARLAELDRTGQPIRYEKEYVRKDGRRVPIELLAHRVSGDDGKALYYHSFIVDITERKRAENDIREANRKLGESVSEFRRVNVELRNARESAVKLMEDALDARRKAESSNVQLRQEIGERKRAQQALQVSEERLRLAQDAAKVGTWIWDVEQSRENMWSAEVWRLFGVDPAGRAPTYELWRGSIHEDDVLTVEPAVQAAVRTGAELSVEWRVRGTERWVMSRAQPVRDADGRVVRYCGIVMDVTERKKAEGVLKQSKEDLEKRVRARTAELVAANEHLQHEVAERKRIQDALLDQSRILDGFFQHTATPLVFLDRDFDFIRVNEAYAKACQRDPSEFPGHNHFEFYPHEENERIFREVVRTRKPYQAFAKPFSFPDHPEWGETYWNWTLVPLLDSKGEVETLVFSLEDVTERRKAEQALKASEEKYRELVENANSIILRLDTEGRLVFVNEYGLEFFGYGESELIGREMVGTITPEVESTGRNLRALMAEMRGNPDQYANNVNENVRKDGARMWVAWTNKSVRDEAGRLVEILCVGVDITERRRLDQERQQLADKLIALQEEERRSISSMLHDHLGQLLTVAQLDLESLKLRDSASRRTVRNVLGWLKEVIATVRDMAISLRPPLLDDMRVEAALESLVEKFAEGAHLEHGFQAAAGLPALDGAVRTCLYRVLQEALTNVGRHAAAHRVEVSLSAERGSVRLEVSDDGRGFDAAARGGGKGIGLVSMRERIRQCGGRFSVRSEPGKGTVVVAAVPAAGGKGAS